MASLDLATIKADTVAILLKIQAYILRSYNPVVSIFGTRTTVSVF